MFELLAQESQSNPFGGLLLILPMIAIGYFLLIRPQQKRMRQQRELLGSIEVGDEVVTAGGIFGTVLEIDEDTDVIIVEIAPDVRIRMLRGGISRRLEDDEDDWDDDEADGTDDGTGDEEAGRSS